MKLYLASGNQHKKREMQELLPNYTICIPADAGIAFNPEETGSSFVENSLLKAKALWQIIHEPVIADDSGLCVDYLDGAPGVYSSRFSGEDGNDEANNRKLLQLLEGVPYEKRTAHYVAVITLVYPDGQTVTARGECAGHIAESESGHNGFGYDPLFVPEGYDVSFGHIPAEEKNRISHRGKALEILAQKLAER